MSVIGDLASFVVDSSIDDLPALDRAILRRHVTDAAIAGIAGVHTHEAAALRALAPEATGAEAIAIAAAIVRHTEVDDIHLPSCTTPSSVTVPTALMLAREMGEGGLNRLADAIRVGTEMVVRFGVAIDGPNALFRGVWPTCVAAPLGVAAVAARLWGLDRARTEAALSLALMLMAGRTGRFQGALSGRWVLFIGAIAEGLRAARAAREGFCGDPSLLDGPWLTKAHGIPADMSHLTERLGGGGLYPGLSMKPFCTARQALGAADAFMALLDEGLDPRSVESILVRAPETYVGMISQPINPSNRSSGFVSAGFQMGLAAFRRDSLWDLDRRAIMNDVDALALAAKTRVIGDAALQAEFPRRWPAVIAVRSGGQTIERSAISVTGDPDRPLDDERVRDKGLRILSPLIGNVRAHEVVTTAMRGLDNARSASALCVAFDAAMAH